MVGGTVVVLLVVVNVVVDAGFGRHLVVEEIVVLFVCIALASSEIENMN